jgi:hypothetical protein
MALKQHYVPEDHEGKLYRVRDKDFGRGHTTIVWGSHLEHEDAVKLKERVVGAGKTMTARIENMDVPLPANAVTPKGEPLTNEAPRGLPRPSSVVTAASPPHPDPVIHQARQNALAAARATAQEAQQRAAQAQAQVAAAQAAAQLMDVPEIDVPEGIETELDELADGESAALD